MDPREGRFPACPTCLKAELDAGASPHHCEPPRPLLTKAEVPQPGRLGLSPETMREVLVRKRLCLAGVAREASRTDRDGQVVGRGATALNK